MKLKDEYITYDAGEGKSILVASGSETKTFRGFLRMNATSRFVVDCLREDTTKEEILDRMAEEYDADRASMASDLDMIIDTLNEIGALE